MDGSYQHKMTMNKANTRGVNAFLSYVKLMRRISVGSVWGWDEKQMLRTGLRSEKKWEKWGHKGDSASR